MTRLVAKVLLTTGPAWSPCQGVTIGISSRLQPSFVEVNPVDEFIMRLRLKHSLGFMSVVAV